MGHRLEAQDIGAGSRVNMEVGRVRAADFYRSQFILDPRVTVPPGIGMIDQGFGQGGACCEVAKSSDSGNLAGWNLILANDRDTLGSEF